MIDINSEKFKNLSDKELYSLIFSEIGNQNNEVLLLGADAIRSNNGSGFLNQFPERTFDLGIAEQNMISVGAGLAKLNKIPMIGYYGFLVLRTLEQIRDDICYQNLNVKIYGTHSGVAMAAGGVTHHSVSEISCLRSLQNITIIQPATPKEAVASITYAVLEHNGPVYMRLPDVLCKEFYDENYNFEIGKAYTLKDGNDITIISSGTTVSIAKDAVNQLIDKGISVRLINIPTLKPIDKNAIIKAAIETKGIITIEDNELSGGLGAEICQVVCENSPTTVKMIGFPKDRFTVIGPSQADIFNYFNINVSSIIQAAEEILK